MAAAKRSVLSSLAVYAEDSDPESDSEAGTAGSDGGAATGEGREGRGGGGGSGRPLPGEGKAPLVAASPFLMVFLFPFSLGEKGGLVSVGYGDDDFTRLDGDEDGYEEEDDENSRQSVSTSLSQDLGLIPFMRCRGFSLSKESPEWQPTMEPGISDSWCGFQHFPNTSTHFVFM